MHSKADCSLLISIYSHVLLQSAWFIYSVEKVHPVNIAWVQEQRKRYFHLLPYSFGCFGEFRLSFVIQHVSVIFAPVD